MVRALGEQVSDRVVSLRHQIVDNQENVSSSVELCEIGQSFVEFDSGVSTEQRLELTVAVPYLFGSRFYHLRTIFYEYEYETSLTTARGTSYDGRKGML